MNNSQIYYTPKDLSLYIPILKFSHWLVKVSRRKLTYLNTCRLKIHTRNPNGNSIHGNWRNFRYCLRQKYAIIRLTFTLKVTYPIRILFWEFISTPALGDSENINILRCSFWKYISQNGHLPSLWCLGLRFLGNINKASLAELFRYV